MNRGIGQRRLWRSRRFHHGALAGPGQSNGEISSEDFFRSGDLPVAGTNPLHHGRARAAIFGPMGGQFLQCLKGSGPPDHASGNMTGHPPVNRAVFRFRLRETSLIAHLAAMKGNRLSPRAALAFRGRLRRARSQITAGARRKAPSPGPCHHRPDG